MQANSDDCRQQTKRNSRIVFENLKCKKKFQSMSSHVRITHTLSASANDEDDDDDEDEEVDDALP